MINPVQAFQPLLEQSDIASITCVNPLALQPEEHMIATSAARAALLNMTLTLSKELVGKGIRVNSILLGMVESGQWQRRFENRTDKSQSWPEWTAEIARKRGIPMARLGKPQEPAQALLFSPRRWLRLPPVRHWTFPAAFAAICGRHIMKKIMLIGFGAMAQAVIERLPAGVAIGWIVAREVHHAAIHAQLGDAVVALTSPLECAQTPDWCWSAPASRR